MSNSTSIASSGSSSASETLITNAFLPGQNFQLERYQNYAGEWLKESADRHIIVQICQSAAWAERRSVDGSWVQFLKEPGSLTIVPAGPVPDVRLLVFGELQRARKVGEQIETGMLHINDTTLIGDAKAPFGGMKGSKVLSR
jgi:hypothetical protein